MFDDKFYINAKIFDIILSDISEKDIIVACDEIGVPCYKEPVNTNLKVVSGVMVGPYSRIVIALPFKITNKSIYVPFIINTGSPFTYISKNIINKLEVELKEEFNAEINGQVLNVYTSTHNFKDICILGHNYMSSTASKLTCYYYSKKVFLEKNIIEINEF